jgi:hypothetical protein
LAIPDQQKGAIDGISKWIGLSDDGLPVLFFLSDFFFWSFSEAILLDMVLV